MKKLIVLFLIAAGAPALMAQEPDAEGCKDSSLLNRIKGCYIVQCDKKDFDQAEITVSVVDGQDKKQTIEGEVESITYYCPANVSPLMIARNAEAALKAAGFTTVFSGKDEFEAPAFTARKGGLWASIHARGNANETTYIQTVVRTQEMEQQMVASAESMEAEIGKSGYCSIYGINFDTGKATIKSDSAKCLTEMAKLLKKNPSWKMQIEGHTDNVGVTDANVKLSQARAESVRSWLMSHQIEGGRLVAKGFGESKPLADNKSEEGRAKNRRVDLRKI
jgi:outer membrane protein OmpA-like peptidoglycan-associated protein